VGDKRYAGADSVFIVQEAGLAPGSVWTVVENLVPLGIRSPDRSARSESLCCLSHHGPHYLRKGKAIPIEAWTVPEVSRS